MYRSAGESSPHRGRAAPAVRLGSFGFFAKSKKLYAYKFALSQRPPTPIFSWKRPLLNLKMDLIVVSDCFE